MGGNPWRARAHRDTLAIATSVLVEYGDAHVSLTLTKHDPGLIITPTIALHDGLDGEGFLRAVLNCAWELGLRPDGYEDVRENMKATNAHLQDMRAIAFHKMGATKP